jgi:PAS domain S-box-containing protein
MSEDFDNIQACRDGPCADPCQQVEALEALVATRTAALQESEARFRAVFDASGIGILLVDPEGQVLESNPALQDMLGYSEQQMLGASLPHLLVDADVRREISACLGQLMFGHSDRLRLETRFVRKDGHALWVLLTMAPVPGAAGQPPVTAVMVEDITEERNTRTALIQAERLAMAGRLGASIAHEINNPLQSIVGCLALAEETLSEGGDAGRYLQVAHEELRRVVRTVAQLRDLHDVSTTGERILTDVNELLDQLTTLSRPKCIELRISMQWKPAARLPQVLVAPDRIRQVFLNLLLNALDAMPEGGQLSVSTGQTRNPKGVRVVVRDTGQGMSPEVLSRVFEPFYSTKKSGLGLGLFTSRSIVERHGGCIEARSQPGQGTAFTLWLPVDSAPEITGNGIDRAAVAAPDYEGDD